MWTADSISSAQFIHMHVLDSRQLHIDDSNHVFVVAVAQGLYHGHVKHEFMSRFGSWMDGMSEQDQAIS
jgi:hypothetical protein